MEGSQPPTEGQSGVACELPDPREIEQTNVFSGFMVFALVLSAANVTLIGVCSLLARADLARKS